MALLFSACRETDGESSLAYLTTLGSAVKLYYRLAKILWIGIGRVNDCGLDHQQYITRLRRETEQVHTLKS